MSLGCGLWWVDRSQWVVVWLVCCGGSGGFRGGGCGCCLMGQVGVGWLIFFSFVVVVVAEAAVVVCVVVVVAIAMVCGCGCHG